MVWKKIGRVVNEEGTTVCYAAEGTDITIESRKRHIPHAARGGTWDHTTYWVLKDGVEVAEKWTLQQAKGYAEHDLLGIDPLRYD